MKAREKALEVNDRLLIPEERNKAIVKAKESYEDDIKAGRIMQLSNLAEYIAYEVAKVQRDLTSSIKDTRYLQAVKDAGTGRDLDLTEREFEVFSTIRMR